MTLHRQDGITFGEPSTFQVELRALAATHQAQLEQLEAKRKAAAKAEEAFKKEWYSFRDEKISPVLSEAADILSADGLEFARKNLNSNSCELRFRDKAITFRTDAEHKWITCSGSGLEDEQFDFSTLAVADVKLKTKMFVEACLALPESDPKPSADPAPSTASEQSLPVAGQPPPRSLRP